MKKLSPEELVDLLLKEGTTLEDYQKVQDRRLERMATWTKLNQVTIMVHEKRLIDYGEKVIAEYRKRK